MSSFFGIRFFADHTNCLYSTKKEDAFSLNDELEKVIEWTNKNMPALKTQVLLMGLPYDVVFNGQVSDYQNKVNYLFFASMIH